MTDQELLTMAAKVAWYITLTNGQTYSPEAGNFDWNPLTDDGDALRLAVQLFRDIHFWYFENSVSVGNELRVACGDDPCAATRRAIVRAAAEIGRNMK